MSLEPLETAAGGDHPYCRQLSVFLENRLGQLLRITRLFDSSEIRILAISVEGSVDCAIVRLIVDDPDTAHKMLSDAGFALSEAEVVVVGLPFGKRGIMSVCGTLIAAEININYIYSMLPRGERGSCMVIHTDNLSQATESLRARKLVVYDQSDL